MKKATIIGLVLIFAGMLALSSCAGGPRKCNGKRGTRTPMGVM